MADRSLSTTDPAIKRKAKRPREQHGMNGTPTYLVWAAVLRRCTNPNSKDYPRYGGRGITVCERWAKSFAAFYADMGEKPPGMQIDRIKNERGYEPDNCRWVTSQVNNRNRRDSVYVEYRGERLHIRELADRHGIRPATLAWRLKHGMSVERAVEDEVGFQNERVTFLGEEMTMAELEHRSGISRDTIRARMSRDGMSLEEAASVPLKRQPFLVIYKGQTMRLSELAALTGMNELTLAYRIRKKGMTADDAAAMPLQR
jgi:hypothetical protein